MTPLQSREQNPEERHGLHVQHVLDGGRVRKSTRRTTSLCAEAMEHCARLDLKRSPASRNRLGQRCRLALTFSPEVGAAASGSAAQTQLLRRGPSHQLDPGLAGILQPLCFRPELTHGAGLPRQRVRVRAGTTHSPTGAQKPLTSRGHRPPPTPRRRWSNRPRTTDAPLLVGKGSHSLGPLLVQRQKTLPMNPSKGHSEAERYCGDAAERGVMRANSLPRSRRSSLPDPECAPDSAPSPTTETVGDVSWRSSGSWASFDAVPEKAAPNVVSI